MGTAIALAVLLIGMVIVAIFACIGLDLIGAKIAARVMGRDEMLSESPPDIVAFEECYNMAVPPLLRDLYVSGTIHKLEGLTIEETNDDYAPIAIQRCFTMSRDTCLTSTLRINNNCYAFAVDEFDNYYFIDLLTQVSDYPVLYHDHDSNDIIHTHATLRQLIDAVKGTT